MRIQKGVEFNQTYGPDLAFRIAANEGIEYDSGWAELSGVQVTFYAEGKVSYGLSADRGRFHVGRKEAHTVGQTLLSLRGGVAVRSEGFVYRGSELRLDSQGPVALAGARWAGVAEHARVELKDDALELTQGVSVAFRQREERSLVLVTPRLRYERKHAAVVFPEGLEVLSDGLRFRAARGQVQFAGEEGDIRRVELSGPITLHGTLPDGTPIAGKSGDLSLERGAEGRWQLAAAAMPLPGWVWVRWLDPVAGWQELQAWRLLGEGKPQAWEWLEGQGTACGFQVGVVGSQARRLEAERMRLGFDNGRPATAVASGQVLVESGLQWAQGGTLEMALASRAFTLLPQPGGRVTFGDGEVEAWCDQLAGTAAGTVIASGKVGGLLRRPSAKGEEPTRFAAASAELPPDKSTVRLAGDARIWQHDRLVRAEQVRYERERDEVVGEGQVLSRAPIQTAEGGELVVRSRRLQYSRRAGTILYEGEVEVEDARGRASCGKLVVYLGDDQKARRIHLEGGVSVTEAATGRVLTAQRGELDLLEDVLEMWGMPVVVQEPSGNQIKGDHLVWRRRTGNVVVRGGEDSPSETLYHPGEEGALPTPPRR